MQPDIPTSVILQELIRSLAPNLIMGGITLILIGIGIVLLIRQENKFKKDSNNCS